MLTINPASDIRIEVTETSNVVEEPILALCDFALLGSTYTMSFYCK